MPIPHQVRNPTLPNLQKLFGSIGFKMYQQQSSMDYHEQQHWAPGSSGQQQGWLEAGGKVREN